MAAKPAASGAMKNIVAKRIENMEAAEAAAKVAQATPIAAQAKPIAPLAKPVSTRAKPIALTVSAPNQFGPVKTHGFTFTHQALDNTLHNTMQKFTLSPIHVSYANTLRRIILTGIDTVAFRSDMTSTGTTTDVLIEQNDTPMTNEMLADRIGLLPLYIENPLTWKKDELVFSLDVIGNTDAMTYVTASDFKIMRRLPIATEEVKDGDPTFSEIQIATNDVFRADPVTNQTALIAMLTPATPPQRIKLTAYASKGTGREHARFSPVSQCSYEYSLDTNPERQEKMFIDWLLVAKKISGLGKDTPEYAKLQREFNTMQIKRCYLVNEKQEPYSFDFTVETVGPLPIHYIMNQACEAGANMLNKFTNMHVSVPETVTISMAASRIIGFDFLIRGHDHTLGNLLQTWLVEHHIEGGDRPHITYAGYSVPHPLRDEMILRIGVADGNEDTAKLAIATAARGCENMFRELRQAWNNSSSSSIPSRMGTALRRASANVAAAMKEPPSGKPLEQVNVTKLDA